MFSRKYKFAATAGWIRLTVTPCKEPENVPNCSVVFILNLMMRY